MSKFGATFLPEKKYNLPLKIISSEMPLGINYESGISAQLKSAAILAGLNSFGVTEILEKQKSRDHTERMLSKNNNAQSEKKSRPSLSYDLENTWQGKTKALADIPSLVFVDFIGFFDF